jgi:hypothetical protein
MTPVFKAQIFSIKRNVAYCSGESSLNHSSYFSETRILSLVPRDWSPVMDYFSFPSLLLSQYFTPSNRDTKMSVDDASPMPIKKAEVEAPNVV